MTRMSRMEHGLVIALFSMFCLRMLQNRIASFRGFVYLMYQLMHLFSCGVPLPEAKMGVEN
jgi:hypothetical protein